MSDPTGSSNRRCQSVFFNSGKKILLRAPYVGMFIYESKLSQRHLLTVIENNRLGSPLLSLSISSMQQLHLGTFSPVQYKKLCSTGLAKSNALANESYSKKRNCSS